MGARNKLKKLHKLSNVALILAIITSVLLCFNGCDADLEGLMPTTNTIIGVSWDRSESTALTRLTTDTDEIVTENIETEPIAGVGAQVGASPFDNYYPWNAMMEYYVVDNELIKASDLTVDKKGEYDTVVYIPQFYYRVVDDADGRKFYVSAKYEKGFAVHPGSNNYVAKYNTNAEYKSVSGAMPLTNVTRDEVRQNARAKGSKWSQYDFATWNAIQMLYLVEYANWDVQTTIGRGVVDEIEPAQDYIHLTGETDSMAYHTGRAEGVDGLTQVKYRNIEGLWGNVCEWVDGINVSDRAVYISLDYKKYADDTSKGYVKAGVSLPKTGRIQGLGYSSVFPWAFLPNASIDSADYSTNIYVPDKVCSGTGWRTLYTSNNASGVNLAGLFRFATSSASNRKHPSYGCRLVYQGN